MEAHIGPAFLKLWLVLGAGAVVVVLIVLVVVLIAASKGRGGGTQAIEERQAMEGLVTTLDRMERRVESLETIATTARERRAEGKLAQPPPPPSQA